MLARIVRAHGIRGAVVAATDDCGRGLMCAGTEVALASPDLRDAPQRVTITGVAPHRAGALLRLEGVNDRDRAEALVGCDLLAERCELPETASGEYYACDLLGLTVVAPDGGVLGTLDDIVSTGANDVWVVRGGSEELLVPAVAHAVLDVDVEKRRITVDPTAAERA